MSQDPLENTSVDGEGLRFAIVASRYNRRFVDALLDSALRTLGDAGVKPDDIETVRVPGALEIPYVAEMLAKGGEFDCIIALGVIIEGDTSHHDVIARSTADAFLRTCHVNETPVINGVIDVHNAQQAEERCTGRLDRGAEFARSALEMADLKVQLVRRLDEIFGDEEDEPGDKGGWEDLFGGDQQNWKS
jgi:6,7-dimethyl-8-ribityllumazine synthase